MEIVEYEMKNYYCTDCQRKSLINIRGVLRCPQCGSPNVELARPRRTHRVTEDHQWDNYMNSFTSPTRPNNTPGNYFSTGISHFGGLFSRRERNLFNVFFIHFPGFSNSQVHGFFDEPHPFFTTMFDLGDILNHMAEQYPHEGHQPASSERIERLQDVVVGEAEVNETCSVCQDSFKIGDIAKVLPCKHQFHKDCILPWFRVKDSCPLCRHQI